MPRLQANTAVFHDVWLALRIRNHWDWKIRRNRRRRRTKNRDELAEQYLQIDPHSPAEFRTNGIASNVDLFYDAFGVTEGDAMWLAPKDRVRIW